MFVCHCIALRWGVTQVGKFHILGIAHPVVGIYFSGTEEALGDGTHSGLRSEEMAKLVALSCIFVKFWTRNPVSYKL